MISNTLIKTSKEISYYAYNGTNETRPYAIPFYKREINQRWSLDY